MKTIKILIIRWLNNNVTCLGWQLKEIISLIQELTKDCEWYVGDITINDIKPFIEKKDKNLYRDASGEKVLNCNDIEKLKMLINEVDQFLSGVFVAIPKKKIFLIKNKIQLITEINLKFQILEAKIEIRPFDTSYFQVYTNNLQIINILTKKFNLQKEDIQSIK